MSREFVLNTLSLDIVSCLPAALPFPATEDQATTPSRDGLAERFFFSWHKAHRYVILLTEEEHRRTRAHLLGCWADAAMNMGEYTLTQKKLDESAVYLEHMSAKEEFDRGSWLHLAGKYAFATRNYPTAIDYFEQALAELPSDWIIRRILVLLPMMASYACEGAHDACIVTTNAASSAIRVLNAPSMNRIFTNTIQGILKAFPNDAHLRSFIIDV